MAVSAVRKRKQQISPPRIVVEQKRHSVVNAETGEVWEPEQTYDIMTESAYVVDEVSNFTKTFSNGFIKMRNMGFDIDNVNITLLQVILTKMSYADPESEYGGQTITIDKRTKEEWSKMLEISVDMIKRHVRNMVRSGHMLRVGRGVYMVNPYLYGKGTGKNISMLRTRIVIEPVSSQNDVPSVRLINTPEYTSGKEL